MSAHPRVLIVDDNALNLKLTQALFTSDGWDVRTASDAELALEELSAWVPDLLLTDIQMPGLDGLELTKRVKASPQTSDVTVLAVTAYAMDADRERAIAAGCDGYVSKPIDTRTLTTLAAELAGIGT